MNLNKFNLLLLIICMLSILFLYLIIPYTYKEHVNLCEINKDYVNENVKLIGTINDIHEKNGNIFFELKNKNCTLKAVLWKQNYNALKMKNKNFKLKEGCLYEIIGTINLYKGELEIIPVGGNVNLIKC